MKLSAGKKKTIKFYSFLLVSLILIVIVSGYQYLRSSMPQMSGEIKNSHISKPVSITRDSNGIPHIEAQNAQDAFFTLGFVMASERLFQMEIQRRMANGELAEIFGPKALPTDKLFRNLSLRDQVQKLIEKKIKTNAFDSMMLSRLNAFYDGVNEYIATQNLPIEFAILRFKPKPFTLVDSYAFLGLMGFNFGIATSMEPLLSHLAEKMGAEMVEDLRNERSPMSGARTVQHFPAHQIRYIADAMKFLERGFNLFEGSNGWLLSKERSASGYPILANDPHINFTQPGVWFEAHIKTPEYEAYGHFLPLVPFPILFHNREKAWGFTMSLTDDMDIYRETIDPVKKTYLFKNQILPLVERIEVIKVKGEDDVKVTIFKTHHGPILDEAIDEKSLALQWTFYNPDNDPMTSLFKMGEAKAMDEFRDAVATGISPSLNVLYADKNNIAWWIFGEIWKKRPGIKTDFVLNGESGNDEILGSLTFKEKPASVNPKSGLIVSANARPDFYPENLRGDWQPDDRYKTLESILTKKEQWSPEEVMELQSVNMNFENKILIERLLQELKMPTENPVMNEAASVLKKWNLNSETTSQGAAIYYSWCQELQNLLLKDLSQSERDVLARIPNGWIFLKRVILDKSSLWWKKYDRQLLINESFFLAVKKLTGIFGESVSSWRWGDIHTLEFIHPIGRAKPFNLIFNQGPFKMPGSYNEVNNQKYTSTSNFQITAGPSTRRVIDFKRPEVSWGILPQGNSGHILSPFYGNQVKPYSDGRYRLQLLDLKSEDIRFKMLLLPK